METGKMSRVASRSLLLAASFCHVLVMVTCTSEARGQRRRRLVPAFEDAAVISPETPDDDKGDAQTPLAPSDDHRRNKWVDEWAEWMVDDTKHQIDNLRKHINELTEVGVDTDTSWTEWDRWNSIQAQENKLLATLVPIPLSMIMLFLGISFYRRRKSHQRRRRDRLRRRHIIELNMIRRQLERQTSRINMNPYPRIDISEPINIGKPELSSTSTNPPPYSEALDTDLYPLVDKTAITEDLPAYCEVTALLNNHSHSEHDAQTSQYQADVALTGAHSLTNNTDNIVHRVQGAECMELVAQNIQGNNGMTCEDGDRIVSHTRDSSNYNPHPNRDRHDSCSRERSNSCGRDRRLSRSRSGSAGNHHSRMTRSRTSSLTRNRRSSSTRSRVHTESRKSWGSLDPAELVTMNDEVSTPPVYDSVVDSCSSSRRLSQGHHGQSPPSYNDVFPNTGITVSHL